MARSIVDLLIPPLLGNLTANDGVGSFCYSQPMLVEEAIVLVLAGINFTHVLDFVIMMPLGPQLMQHFSITAKDFSIVVASYTFAAGFSGLLGAFLLDRFDRKVALLICYAGFTLGTLACALAPTFSFLVGARVIAGFFGGIVGSLVFSIVADVVPHAQRGAAMGKISAAFSVASVAGIPIGLYLAQIFNWHASFVLIFGVATIFWLIAARQLPRLSGHLQGGRHHPWQSFLHVLRFRNHWNAFIFIFFLTLAGFTVIPFAMPYLVANVGFKAELIPYLYFFAGLATLFTSPLIGKIADRYGKHRVFRWVATLSIVPIMLLTTLRSSSTTGVVVLMVLFTVLISGRFVPAMAIAASATLPRMRGSYMSLYTSVLQIGSGTASLMGGYLISTESGGKLVGYGRTGQAAAIFTLVCVFFCALVRNEEAQAEPKKN